MRRATKVESPTGQRFTVEPAIDWLFRDRHTGRFVVAQWPNAPLWIFLVASIVKRVAHPHGAAGTALTIVVVASLVWWAGDEVLRGVNPFRRMLGGAVLLLTVVGLVR